LDLKVPDFSGLPHFRAWPRRVSAIQYDAGKEVSEMAYGVCLYMLGHLSERKLTNQLRYQSLARFPSFDCSVSFCRSVHSAVCDEHGHVVQRVKL